jgi:hypothetical protein
MHVFTVDSKSVVTRCVNSMGLILFFLKKYYHGESIAVNVLVDNNTSKSVKKIKISGYYEGLFCD